MKIVAHDIMRKLLVFQLFVFVFPSLIALIILLIWGQSFDVVIALIWVLSMIGLLLCFCAEMDTWIVDAKGIVVKTIYGVKNKIKWDEIKFVKHKYLDFRNRGGKNIDCYVFYHKEKKEKDNRMFYNKKNVPIRIYRNDIIDECIERYYTGTILDETK